MAEPRRTVAVFFGGRSVEHDVSVLTGIQALRALDTRLFDAVPVYMAQNGDWFTGAPLLDRDNYMLSDRVRASLTQVRLIAGEQAMGERPQLTTLDRRPLGGLRRDSIPFDVALPALHGAGGEDGALQGLFEHLGVAYVGAGPMASAATMDKAFTKRVLGALGLPVVPGFVVDRPASGRFVEPERLQALLDSTFGGDAAAFPLCVKPRALGSSIGVARVESLDALSAQLVDVFRLDTAAVVERLIPNLREYNVAVTAAFGEIRLSAIERPLAKADVLDFADKYLANAGAGGGKVQGSVGEGMASATRVIEPDELTDAQRTVIRQTASAAFAALELKGCVRIDFLCDSETGEVWLNEVNSIPGSFAYFLWEPAPHRITFTDLLTALIEEGVARQRAQSVTIDPTAARAAIFKR